MSMNVQILQWGGSPAWAGVPLGQLAVRQPCERFPRVGGGSPHHGELRTIGEAVPPRGRGFPLYRRLVRGVSAGSPAWAGVPRAAFGADSCQMRFPRVGGGSPCDSGAAAAAGVPPRGRGFPAGRSRTRAYRTGSPAWAGVPLYRLNLFLFAERFPRVGGGSPAPVRRRLHSARVPPRGRGFPSAPSAAFPFAPGSPAWAGVPPILSAVSSSSLRFPRVGGGSPLGGRRRRPSGRGSPAWAGVPLRFTFGSKRSFGFPRVGGGSPAARGADSCQMEVPPRGRGFPGEGGARR